MRIYNIYRDWADPDPAKIVFVADRFRFWAFFAPLLWAALQFRWRSLVVVLVGWLAVSFAIAALGDPIAGGLFGLAFSVLLGFEASSLLRWDYMAAGYAEIGMVIASDLEEAELRWVAAECRGEAQV